MFAACTPKNEPTIDVDETLAINTVKVKYEGDKASVSANKVTADLLNVHTTGAHVSIRQSAQVVDEITYVLVGESENGSFTMDGELKATVVFGGVKLTNPSGAAVNILNGKRIDIVLQDGTTSSLTDGIGDQKACMMVNGHAEWKGTGVLELNGNSKHAYWSDEYTLFKAEAGTVRVKKAIKDGLSVNQYFEMYGGTIIVEECGDDGLQVDRKKDDTKEQNGSLIIHAGTLDITSTGDGGKGIKCDSLITINGGEIRVRTLGAMYIDPAYTGDGKDIPDSLKSSPKGIKAGYDLTINNGHLVITTQNDGGEGIESKNTMTINGGLIEIEAYDDCINTTGDMTINGGQVYVNSFDNDGIDSNANLFIRGGLIVTYGAPFRELGIDVNDRGTKKLYVTGGTLVAFGGSNDITRPFTTDGAQPTVIYQGQIAQNQTLLISSGGEAEMAVKQLRDYKAQGNGTDDPKLTMLYSAPTMVVGNSYLLYEGADVTATDEWHGLMLQPTINERGTQIGKINSLETPTSTFRKK